MGIDTQPYPFSDVLYTNTHTGSKELRVYKENHICTDNTTSIPLLANGVFLGAWQDCLNYQEVNVSVITDKNSDTNWLVIQWSYNGISVDDTDVFSVYANAWTNYTPNPSFRYVRLQYTNWATPQTKFSLMTILRKAMTGGSFHRISDTLKDDSDGRLWLSVLKLRTSANTYVSGSATSQWNLKVSLEELENGVKWQQDQANALAITLAKDHYDTLTRAVNIIPYQHHEIHSGSHFLYTDCVELGSAGVQDYLITTPNTTKWSHLSWEIDGSAITDVKVFRATDKTGTTLQTIFNNNENSATVSGMTIHKAVTGWATDWVQIRCHKSGAALWASRSGASSEQASEIILKQNTKYIIRITSWTAANLTNIGLSWYEHTSLV